MFFTPPQPADTQADLLPRFKLMFETSIGFSPAIVTFKKYVDEVVFLCNTGGSPKQSKRLCVVWNYSGKIYFGECRVEGESIVRQGLGMEWLPSRTCVLT